MKTKVRHRDGKKKTPKKTFLSLVGHLWAFFLSLNGQVGYSSTSLLIRENLWRLKWLSFVFYYYSFFWKDNKVARLQWDFMLRHCTVESWIESMTQIWWNQQQLGQQQPGLNTSCFLANQIDTTVRIHVALSSEAHRLIPSSWVTSFYFSDRAIGIPPVWLIFVLNTSLLSMGFIRANLRTIQL